MHKICKECANYDHKNLKHSKACENCVTEHREDGTESDPSNWRALPQTNADRIRAMSDEELAKWLLDVMSHKVACFGEGAFPYTPCRNTGHDCVKCGVDWLKQPAEE